MTLVLVITCLGERFGINYLGPFLKILKFLKIARTKHVVTGYSHQTNKHVVLKAIYFNSGQLQISEWAITK